MSLPDDADMVMHGQVVPEDAYGTEVVDRDRLAEIVQVSSAFGSLMSDLLVSRPDLDYAVGDLQWELLSVRWLTLALCIVEFCRSLLDTCMRCMYALAVLHTLSGHWSAYRCMHILGVSQWVSDESRLLSPLVYTCRLVFFSTY